MRDATHLRTPTDARAPYEPADAAASLAELVAGPPQSGRVLAALRAAVYLAPDDGRVIAIEASDGIGLPNALRLRRPAAGLDLETIAADASVTIGAGRVAVGDRVVAVERWGDARQSLAGVDAEVLEGRLEELDALLADVDPLGEPLGARTSALAAASDRLDAAAMVAAAADLVGLGGGLTPSGDDILCGLLGGGRTFAAAMGLAHVDDTLHDLGGALIPSAAERTTALSAALLWHAARGELARPAAALLRALVGRTPLTPAVTAMLAVGHSSGRDLTIGIAMGARAVLSNRPVANDPGPTTGARP